MTKSNLTDKVVLADSSNYNQGRFGYKVCKITPHHMAGVLSGEACAQIFQNPARDASANYCIGNAGDIVLNVDEDNRAWTSSSRLNDCQAITIEVSNCENGGQWRISDAAWNSLVNLCVDICKRYGFKLTYDGTPNGSLTRHNMFADTSCPGPYLQGRFQELADTVNARLEEKPAEPAGLKYKEGDTVTINGVYVSSTSTEKLTPLINKGKITKVIEGARNPYLLEDGRIGWVNDDCITSGNAPTPAPKEAVYKTVSNCYWLNLRSSASYGNNIATSVQAGTVVEYLGIVNGWAEVIYNGRTLYCGSSYLK
ncbi:MAG: N-acetylmuramoyl-L-alanine amidase [Clostridia bacterium]|nr:N-acetylmuramoyl-L-alanine amidase [Clostridia bacterium]